MYTKASMAWYMVVCGSPDLVVMGGDSSPEGCGFESQYHILDGHFFTLICCKIVLMFAWKIPKINNKEAGNGPVFKKIHGRWQFDNVIITREPSTYFDYRIVLRSEAAILGQRSERLVRKVSTQSPQDPGSDGGPLARHVQSSGSVFKHGRVCQGLQLPPGVQHEP